jgi:hypothetical protein
MPVPRQLKTVIAGARGGDIYRAEEQLTRGSKQPPHFDFLVHGMGLVSHDAPDLTGKGPVPFQPPIRTVRSRAAW